MSADLYRTIPLDASAVRDTGYLRLIGAAICVGMAIWLALIQASWRVGAFAALGALVAVFWVRRFWTSRRQLMSAEARFVALEPTQLRVGRGEADALELAWQKVVAIEVDEDRLEVRVRIDGEQPLYLEPVYGGLGVYELADAVTAAFDASRT